MHPLHVPPAEMEPLSHASAVRLISFVSGPIRRLGFLLAIVLAGIPSLQAGRAYWGSGAFLLAEDSRGRVWDGSFTLTLGVFREGFTPGPENHEEWAAQWIPLADAVFDEEEGRFAGIADLSQALPAGAGRRVFFWARNGGDLDKGPDWLLFTHEAWVWPSLVETHAPALTWTAGEGCEVVVGGVKTSGGKWLSASVRPVAESRDAWLARHFADRPDLAHPKLDADGDGLSNELEYFLGTDPRKASSLSGPELRMHGRDVTVRLPRNPRAKGRFILQTSTDLKSWVKAGGETMVDRPDLLEVRMDRDPDKRQVFFRYQLETEEGEP